MQDGNQTYSYDAFNRTVRVETVEGNYQEKHYDAEGLRAEMVENGELVKFLFAEREVVAETEADGNVIRYIRGYELISSDSEKAKTYYHYVADEQGSITHLVTGVKKVAEDTNIVASVPDTSSTIASIQSASMSTYEQGTSLEDRILNRYEYDAFGNTMYSEEKVQNRFRYTGQQYAPLTQQYYLRARYYNPVIARFTQEDTYHGDGLNLYSYCSNNPLMYYDPSGHAKAICEDKYNAYRQRLAQGGQLTREEYKEYSRYERVQKSNKANRDRYNEETYTGKDSRQLYNNKKTVDDSLYKRSSFRKSTRLKAESEAPRNDSGKMICPTCGKEIPNKIILNTKNGLKTRIGYDLDHYPDTWAERVNKMKSLTNKPSRKEVLDEYNSRVRVQCNPCNTSHKFEGKEGEFTNE